MTHEIRCPSCGRALRYERFHAGFSNLGYLYCNSDETVATWDAYDLRYRAVVGDKNPWMLDEAERRELEDAIAPCPCGGTFSFFNLPRCPLCNSELPGLADDPTYVVVLGRRLDTTSDRLWRDDRAIQP